MIYNHIELNSHKICDKFFNGTLGQLLVKMLGFAVFSSELNWLFLCLLHNYILVDGLIFP